MDYAQRILLKKLAHWTLYSFLWKQAQQRKTSRLPQRRMRSRLRDITVSFIIYIRYIQRTRPSNFIRAISSTKVSSQLKVRAVRLSRIYQSAESWSHNGISVLRYENIKMSTNIVTKFFRFNRLQMLYVRTKKNPITRRPHFFPDQG